MHQGLQINGGIMAIATYKPKEGREVELRELVKQHVSLLRQYGLASSKDNYVAHTQDGTIIEVFEWVSTQATEAAHQHPAVMALWEKMMLIADFTPACQLQEMQRPFPGFELINW